MDFKIKDRYDIEDFLKIMALLRAPDGCPWDRVQTHESIRRNMIEEAYEVVDAIDQEDQPGMQEELGDVLMQVLFHARIEEERGNFSFADVVDGACKKLVFRHPFVFGDAPKSTAENAISDWESQKKIEKAQKSQTDSMRSVPRMFPALIRSSKLQEKAARSQLDWHSAEEPLRHAESILHQLLEKEKRPEAEELQQMIGKLLFYIVGAARLNGVEPEAALTFTSDHFLDQFAQYESAGSNLSEINPTDLID